MNVKFSFILNLLFSINCTKQTTNLKLFKNEKILDNSNKVEAISDIISGFHYYEIILCHSKSLDVEFRASLLKILEDRKISLTLFNFTTINVEERYFQLVQNRMESNLKSNTIFFGSHKLYEHILLEIHQRHLIRRNLIYIFYLGQTTTIYRSFLSNLHHSMRIFAITNPRVNAYRIYYNQATSYKEHDMEMVNWWIKGEGLFYHPTLPNKESVYKDFHGKVLQVPVLHKPPWHFVKYSNTSGIQTFKVLGGRDDKILSVLSNKLNFRYNYSDPPQRVQGSMILENGSFNGVIGMLWRKEADLFIGDIAITYERFKAVEFSFITLADSGAFVTHAPRRLNEALALLRPFQWQVWSVIGVICLIAGPLLYIFIALPNNWQPRFIIRSHIRLFSDCYWYTIMILLKQTSKELSSTKKSRFFVIILSLSATYVVADMYSANLTSLLARPGREKPLNNLYHLRKAMSTKDYKLYVDRQSPSFGLLENGSGIYGEIWNLMEDNQNKYVVDSVEEGVKLVRDTHNIAVMAGRETLFFDIQRFGPKNFHLSHKLNTAYSAIAFPLGCPYVGEINKILMAMFEAGLITKMTEDEYRKLGKQKNVEELDDQTSSVTSIKPDEKKVVLLQEDNEKLKPINLKMLQGCFYLLLIGYIFSGMCLVAEKIYYRQRKKLTKRKTFNKILRKTKRNIKITVKNFKLTLTRTFENFMHDAFTETLEYIE